MGLLSEGSPLSWEKTKTHADHVRKHGIKQFIHQYKKLENLTKDVLYWGDEVEYMLVTFNRKKRLAQLSLRGATVLDQLQEKERVSPDDHPTTWRPEYGAYMVEGTPGKPYGGLMAHFNLVEANMRLRREELQKLLVEEEVPLSLTCFPRIGCPEFTIPSYKPTPQDGASHSLFFPDDAIYPGHPRFRTLTRNIRERRGEKVAINIPVFKDTNTRSPFVEDYLPLGDDGSSQRAAQPDHIYLDAMGFGMGCSCLQVTFQACNITEARHLYDQLTPLCPILLSVSAASPIYRGLLADIDCRWTVISQSVDDRVKEERGEEPLKNYKYIINKSRYDSIDSYLSPAGECYNDIELVYDKELFDELRRADIDRLLSQHISHLFIRDPISLFSEKINQNDEEDTDHFENIQSTNWQTMRFKPPPPNTNIGWRVEFRPMEVQLSDFENAAYVVFIVLLTRVILTFKLNFLIPISKVDENLKTAQKRDSVGEGKFYFRKDFVTESSPAVASECCCGERQVCCNIEDEYDLFTVNEVINGKGSDFPGLIPLINKYMEVIEVDVDTRCTISQYLKLISKRASGELLTTAKWMRNFVTSHPSYRGDSIVNEDVNFDLMELCRKFSSGEAECLDLSFSPTSRTTDDIPKALSVAEAKLQQRKVNSNSKNGHNGNGGSSP